MLTLEQLHTFIFRVSDMYNENEKYLIELDSAIGDGDHGINMEQRGSVGNKQDFYRYRYIHKWIIKDSIYASH